MTIKNILKKLANLFGRSTNSSENDTSSTTKQKMSLQRPILTDHFLLMHEERNNPYIMANYDRALALLQKFDERVANLSMFCYRSGDWYILEVKLIPLWSDDSRKWTDDACTSTSHHTQAVYVVDMSHEHIIRQGDFDALKTVFETLKTRKPHQNDNEEREYLYHITTILLAAAEPGGNFIEPNGGERFPEEVDFPKYAICGDSLIYTWYELSTGMAYHIIKHTLAWDGKTATHQKTEIDMSAPQKLWRKPDKPWR